MATSIKDMGKEDFLEMLGLQSRKNAMDYILPAVGILSAGVLIGAGLGLLFAPRSGRDLRNDLGHRFQEFRGNAEERTSQVV